MLNLKNEDCKKCGLCNYRTKVVNGKGSEQTKILFVSEWPGSPESATGDITRGPIYYGLHRLLLKAGIKTGSIFLTTVVRCIPKDPVTGIREPTKEEVEACSDYLDQEINHIKPHIIVPMGNVALKRILGQRTAMIGKHRGIEMWSEKYNCKIMPILHPIYVNRRLQYSGITIEDLKRIQKSSAIKEITKKRLGHYDVADTVEKVDKLITKLKSVDEFVFDIETSGFNGRKDTLLCVAFSWKDGSGYTIPINYWKGREEKYFEEKEKTVRKKDLKSKAWIKKKSIVKTEKIRIIDEYFPYWDKNQRQVIDKLRALMASDVPKIAHNAKFDTKFLFENLKMSVNKVTFDTMLAHYLLDENAPSHGLKDLAWSVEMGGYDEPVEKWFKDRKIAPKNRNYAHLPQNLLYEYNAKDTDCTMRLKQEFQPSMKKDGVWNVFRQLVMILSETLMLAEAHGMKVDLDYIDKLKDEFKKQIAGIDADIKNLVGDINISSTPQLRELLFKKLKLPTIKKTAKGQDSTDESVLELLTKQHPIVPKILERRKSFKLYKTYVIGIDKLLDEDGLIHPEFLIHGTVTGRLSCKNPNLQNIPRGDNRIKRLFIARSGWILIEADYGQVEFRFWAHYSQDKKMINDIISATNGTGPDVHRLMASLALGIPVNQITDDQRNDAKRVVFGLMYGRGSKSIAEQLGCTEEHAKKVARIFLSRYPQANAWLQGAIKEVKRTKQIRSCFGRLRRLPTIDSPDSDLAAMAERQAMNSPIQSAASDLNCNATNKIRFRFAREGLRGELKILVHDSMIVEVPLDEFDRSVNILKEEMERPVLNMTIPMVADIKTGVRWGELKKLPKKAVVASK